MTYSYFEAVKADVKNYIEESITLDEYRGERDRLEEELNNRLFTEDSVTGTPPAPTLSTAPALVSIASKIWRQSQRP